MKNKCLAIIPARGGSKGILNKNIAEIGGKPLIYWTIISAQKAKSVDRIVVTTDSEDISAIAKNYGAEVPFKRPPELARENTHGIYPVLHTVLWLQDHQDYRPDFVLCLQPTSPFRIADDIDAAMDLALSKNADAVVSVIPANQHPYWMKRLDNEGLIQAFIPLDQPFERRQDLPPVYALNGAIYLVRPSVLIEQKSWYTDRTFAYVMPPERSLDIDTPWDLYLANLVLKDRIAK